MYVPCILSLSKDDTEQMQAQLDWKQYSQNSMTLKMLKVAEAEIEKIKRLEFDDERESAIVNFAFKAATDPHRVTDQDLQRLRDLAFSDKQILEALGVMEIFSAYNRFLDALDVPS